MTNNRKRTFQRIRLNITPNGRISLSESPVKFATRSCRRNCMGKYRKESADTKPKIRDLNITLARKLGRVRVVKIR
jgi:hypothetical protein